MDSLVRVWHTRTRLSKKSRPIWSPQPCIRPAGLPILLLRIPSGSCVHGDIHVRESVLPRARHTAPLDWNEPRSFLPDNRSLSQYSNRLAPPREFRKIYSHSDGRFTGAICKEWPLHHRQLISTCNEYDVPYQNMCHFLLLFCHRSAVHFFMETVNGRPRGKADWKKISMELSARYPSKMGQEEASSILARHWIGELQFDSTK